MITFLPKDEPDLTHAAEALARALVGIARSRSRIAMLATIDGEPALESPLAKILGEHGFAARRGALVFIPSRGGAGEGAGEGRRGQRARQLAEYGQGFSAFGREASLHDARTAPPAPPARPGSHVGDEAHDGDSDPFDDDDDAVFDDELATDDELAPDDGLAPGATAPGATAPDELPPAELPPDGTEELHA